MTINFYAGCFLEVSASSGTYLFWPIQEKEYKLVKKLISHNAVGKAWQLLKKHKWEKKDEPSR